MRLESPFPARICLPSQSQQRPQSTGKPWQHAGLVWDVCISLRLEIGECCMPMATEAPGSQHKLEDPSNASSVRSSRRSTGQLHQNCCCRQSHGVLQKMALGAPMAARFCTTQLSFCSDKRAIASTPLLQSRGLAQLQTLQQKVEHKCGGHESECRLAAQSDPQP